MYLGWELKSFVTPCLTSRAISLHNHHFRFSHINNTKQERNMETSSNGNPPRKRSVPIQAENCANNVASNPIVETIEGVGSPVFFVSKESSATSEGGPKDVHAPMAVSNKRPRTRDPQNEFNIDGNNHTHKRTKGAINPSPSIPKSPPVMSVESLLSLPVSFLFRQTKSTNTRTSSTNHIATVSTSLLSRLEASILLQISNLAHEFDHLQKKSIEALHHSRLAQDLSFSLASSSDLSVKPYTRSLHPYLQMRGVTLPQKLLQYSQINIERILEKLKAMNISLKQCCEQNFSVADTLLDTIGDENDNDSEGGTVGKLAREKSQLAELEEEMSRRIEGLIQMGQEVSDSEEGSDYRGRYTDIFDQAVDENGEFISIAKLCESMFPTEKALVIVNDKSTYSSPKLNVEQRKRSVPCENSVEKTPILNESVKSKEEVNTSSSSGPRESVQVNKDTSRSEAAKALEMLGRSQTDSA